VKPTRKPQSGLPDPKRRAGRNRTIELTDDDRERLRGRLIRPDEIGGPGGTENRIICGDAPDALAKLPEHSVDLLFADPPYNLRKSFGANAFRETSPDEYEEWLETWLGLCVPLLKPTASVYICGDWRSASSIQRAGSRRFILRNRITWEREKGRGAKRNWKNSSEDIWFFTVSDDYTFNPDAVKIKRRVLAPYKENGQPKDWESNEDGNFRLTHASNIWTDLSVPFWSMPENTDHPTQKPEKLLAKVILASTSENDLILDPFAGSGTTAVAAKKLGRRFIAVECDEDYCLLAEKRLSIAESEPSIQGYRDNIFWERNTKLT
jgi:site-specific DNA-methyltransferase (adenine-specific)